MQVQRIPRINNNDNTVEILRWHVVDGDKVVVGQDLADLGTSKATVTIETSASGFVRRMFPEGALAPTGAVIVEFHSSAAAIKANETAVQSAALATGTNLGFTRLSKKAEERVQASGLTLESLQGRGLVTARHLFGHSLGSEPQSTMPINRGTVPHFAPDFSNVSRSERLKKAKCAEIESLMIAQSGNVNSSLTIQFNSAEIVATLRRNQAFQGNLLPLILYEFSQLVRKTPLFNSFYHDGYIHYYDSVNVGVAMDMGEGLKAPVIRKANELMPIDFFESLTDFGMKLVSNKLGLEDMTGGTVTITDLSGHGVLHFQPLLNRQQSVILGIGGDASMPGQPLSLTLTFDHRVLTGRDVARFLNQLKEKLLAYPNVLNGQA